MNPNKWWFVFSIALGVLVFMLSLVMGTITSAWVLYELVFGDDEDFAFYAIWPGIAFAMASTFAYWSMLTLGRFRAFAITMIAAFVLCVVVWFGTNLIDEVI